MTLNSNWGPDEDSKALFTERCWLQSAIVGATAYGIAFTLYLSCFCLLVRNKNCIESKTRLILLIVTSLLFFFATFFVVALAAFTQMAFIDYRDYPGGPNAFEIDMFSIPMNSSGNIAVVLSTWLSDLIMIWRFKVIFQMCRIPLWITMLFPCLIFLGSIAFGILLLLQVSTTNPYLTNGANFTFPTVCISLALNGILTIAVVLRLLTFRHRIVSILGPRYGTQYTSAIAMLVESAALYSTLGIAFLVLLGIRNAVGYVFAPCLTQFQTVSTLLIVFRVARGRAWTQSTAVHVITRPSPEE